MPHILEVPSSNLGEVNTGTGLKLANDHFLPHVLHLMFISHSIIPPHRTGDIYSAVKYTKNKNKQVRYLKIIQIQLLV